MPDPQPIEQGQDRTHNLMVPSWIRFCYATIEHLFNELIICISSSVRCLFMSFAHFFFLFFSLGSCLPHMEVPRLGVELELQLPAYATATATWDPSYVCNLHHSSQQCQILNPLSKTKDRTCNLMVPSWIVSAEPQRELP